MESLFAITLRPRSSFLLAGIVPPVVLPFPFLLLLLPLAIALCWMDIHPIHWFAFASLLHREGGSAIKSACKSPAALPDMAPTGATCCSRCSCCCCCYSAKLLSGRVIVQRSPTSGNRTTMRLDRMSRLVQRCRHPCWCLDHGWANKLHQWQAERERAADEATGRDRQRVKWILGPGLALPCAAGGWLITLNCNLYAPSVSQEE